jgi:hypothetical protein
MPDHNQTRYLNPKHVASEYSVPEATLATLRCRGGGPLYIKRGAKIIYDRADIESWLNGAKRANTSQTSAIV